MNEPLYFFFDSKEKRRMRSLIQRLTDISIDDAEQIFSIADVIGDKQYRNILQRKTVVMFPHIKASEQE